MQVDPIYKQTNKGIHRVQPDRNGDTTYTDKQTETYLLHKVEKQIAHT